MAWRRTLIDKGIEPNDPSVVVFAVRFSNGTMEHDRQIRARSAEECDRQVDTLVSQFDAAEALLADERYQVKAEMPATVVRAPDGQRGDAGVGAIDVSAEKMERRARFIAAETLLASYEADVKREWLTEDSPEFVAAKEAATELYDPSFRAMW